MGESIHVSFSDVANRCDYVGDWIDGDWHVVEREWCLTGWQPAKVTPVLRRRLYLLAARLQPLDLAAA
jgi:hypothetical protein